MPHKLKILKKQNSIRNPLKKSNEPIKIHLQVNKDKDVAIKLIWRIVWSFQWMFVSIRQLICKALYAMIKAICKHIELLGGNGSLVTSNARYASKGQEWSC